MCSAFTYPGKHPVFCICVFQARSDLDSQSSQVTNTFWNAAWCIVLRLRSIGLVFKIVGKLNASISRPSQDVSPLRLALARGKYIHSSIFLSSSPRKETSFENCHNLTQPSSECKDGRCSWEVTGMQHMSKTEGQGR